jgi:hypothetical protein
MNNSICIEDKMKKIQLNHFGNFHEKKTDNYDLKMIINNDIQTCRKVMFT